MSAKIFTLNNDELLEMREHPFKNEDSFQAFLERHPQVLQGDGIELILVERESAVPDGLNPKGRWSLDHLFLDKEGTPTLVEVKRSSDTRIRREVVGQMLEYAANVVKYWPPQTIRIQYEQRCQQVNRDPLEEIQEFLNFDEDPDHFWETVETNLRAGKIRMFFVADEIPQELLNIVEFLNEQMNPAEVLAVEVKRFKAPNQRMETTVANILGHTATSKQVKSRKKPVYWNEELFFKELVANHDQRITEAVKQIIRWSDDQGFQLTWGRGPTLGTFYPTAVVNGQEHKLIGIYTSGQVEIDFRHFPLSDEETGTFWGKINSLQGVDMKEEAKNSWLKISIETFVDNKNLDGFLDHVLWAASKIE